MSALLRHRRLVLVSIAIVLCTIPIVYYWSKQQPSDRSDRVLPSVMLWAWERPISLPSLPANVGVAYLAETIFLCPDSITEQRRVNAIHIAPETYLLPVVRIESRKRLQARPNQMAEDVACVALMIDRVVHRGGSNAVQIDYDAPQTEREFYRLLLERLRAMEGPSARIEITALASWCMYDPWIDSLPIDGAVTMLFRMGAENAEVMRAISQRNSIRSTLAAETIGISLDEPIPIPSKCNRLYVFNPGPWTNRTLARVLAYQSRFD